MISTIIHQRLYTRIIIKITRYEHFQKGNAISILDISLNGSIKNPHYCYKAPLRKCFELFMKCS